MLEDKNKQTIKKHALAAQKKKKKNTLKPLAAHTQKNPLNPTKLLPTRHGISPIF